MEKESEGESSRKEVEVAPALIAVHPEGISAAVAVGSELHVFDLFGGYPLILVDYALAIGQPFHTDTIRAIRFGENAKFFVSAGDDKTVKIWAPRSWNCISTVTSEKRITAVAIRETQTDGSYVCYADEFCFVWVVDLDSDDKKPAKLLNHHGCIITGLEFSPDNRLIVSTDQDCKIRVTKFPKNPLNGAREIQSFCIGHEGFISRVAFPPAPEGTPGLLLISGSTDSTVMLWDTAPGGPLLDTCEVAARVESYHRSFPKEGILESIGNAEKHGRAVTDLCITRGYLAAVAIQGFKGIVVLNCDVPAQTLSIAMMVSLVEDAFVPTCLASCLVTKDLWMVTGNYSSSARVIVISGIISARLQPVVLPDDKIHVVTRLQEILQRIASVDNNAFLPAADQAVKRLKTGNTESSKKTGND